MLCEEQIVEQIEVALRHPATPGYREALGTMLEDLNNRARAGHLHDRTYHCLVKKLRARIETT